MRQSLAKDCTWVFKIVQKIQKLIRFWKFLKVDTQRILDNIQQIDLLNKYFDERYDCDFFQPGVQIFL